MRIILGISAFYHDSAAALLEDDKIIAAAQEERFVRVKNTAVFPVESIKYCLSEAGLELDDLDAIVFYDKPLLKFERLLETYFEFAPKGFRSFMKAIPIWLREKLFFKNLIRSGLDSVGTYNKKKLNLLFSEHHISHAASAFYTSNFRTSAILTIDGVGEWSTTTLAYGDLNRITIHKELHFPHSVGLLYSSFTYFLGFKINSGEYKLMGLAPYGSIKSAQTQEYISNIRGTLVDIKSDGSIWLDQSYFNYATGLTMINQSRWERLFKVPMRDPDSEIKQHHCNLALAIQLVTEEIILKMAKEVKRLTGSSNLCLAGGVALNCVANGKLLRSKIFDNLFIQPASGDAGGCIGAALAAYYLHFDEKRIYDSKNVFSCFLGPEYSDKEVSNVNRKSKAISHHYENFDDIKKFVASKLIDGKVIGWFQGRMEFGPRALGNRSILASAANPSMQRILNLKIKYREGFRPFAPSVLIEDMQDFFELDTESPYMLIVAPISQDLRNVIPQDYDSFSLREKLNLNKSKFPSITHVDFSARVQSVKKEDNPRYWELLQELKRQSGSGIVINTSFNVRDEPIVCSPQDAYRCFMATEMDFLVINNFIYSKEEQLS